MKAANSYRIIFVLAFAFFSCGKDSDSKSSNPFFGFQYFPLNLGSSSIYQIDSIAYDDFTGRVDTFSFQKRYSYEEEKPDLANRMTYKVGVYRRTSDSAVWKKIKIIQVLRDSRRIELLEDNLVTIPLVFPIDITSSWNVNAKNTGQEERYSYEALHRSANINSLYYDSTITVNQREEQNLIERFLEVEKYAARVGLVYQRKLALQTEFNGAIKSGFDYRMQLLSHSN